MKLTDVVLESGPFFCSGEAVEPTVAVKAGKKYVPSSGYTVSYNRRQMSPASKFTKAAGSIFERQWWV